MKMTIESTAEFAEVNGTRCRVWKGYSEAGAPVIAFVRSVAVPNGVDGREFERDLRVIDPPEIRRADP